MWTSVGMTKKLISFSWIGITPWVSGCGFFTSVFLHQFKTSVGRLYYDGCFLQTSGKTTTTYTTWWQSEPSLSWPTRQRTGPSGRWLQCLAIDVSVNSSCYYLPDLYNRTLFSTLFNNWLDSDIEFDVLCLSAALRGTSCLMLTIIFTVIIV